MLLRSPLLWMVASKRARLTHTMPVLGIKREEKSRWECRAPLTPSHLTQLKESHPHLRVLVQPCNKRVFTDEEWKRAGAELKDDLSEAEVILGVKEVPLSVVQPQKTYLCFSHTHKGQSYNMAGLRRFLDQKCTLIDYELLTDEAGRRLVAFGEFAGYAGMIDCLSGLGDRLLQRGMHSPLLHLGLAHHYPSLEEAERAVKVMGEQIASQGLPSNLPVMTFIFTGNGNVSRGAQRIFRLLPHRWVKPEELATVQSNGHEVIGCIVEAEHYMVRKDGKPFDPLRFRTNPEEYRSLFAEKVNYAFNALDCAVCLCPSQWHLLGTQVSETVKQG